MKMKNVSWVEPRPSLGDLTPREVTSTRIITFPAKYIIGRGCLLELWKHISFLGPSKALIIGGKSALAATQSIILESLGEHNVEVVMGEFRGNSTRCEIERIKELGQESGVDIVIGTGGGRAADTAKAVAFYLKLPVVIIPTITATDAPMSRCSIVYNDKGEFETYLVYPKNTDVIIIDSQIIANAPVRYLTAGMGSALALYMEAKTNWKAGVKNYAGGLPPWTTLAIARETFENLLRYGKAAKLALENKAVTPAVEIIIETITLLGAITFETCSMSVAHSIYHGFRGAFTPEVLQKHLSGEIAAFGTLVHQVLENHPMDEIYRVIEFNRSVGLPTSLTDLDLKETDTEAITKIAQIACTTGTARNVWFHIEPKMIFDAILTADAISRDFRG